jgi:hypothetical protein
MGPFSSDPKGSLGGRNSRERGIMREPAAITSQVVRQARGGTQMSQDADPVGIQRLPESLTTGPSRSSIAASQWSALPLSPQSDANLRLSGASQLLRRLSVLGVGLALGAVFSLWVAGAMIFPGTGFAERAMTWAYVMGGPIIGAVWGVDKYFPVILLGWLGLLMIPAHPCHPHPVTGCVTLLGFSLWFFAGFLAVMVATWGA